MTHESDRNFDTISPSAKSLMLMKGHTNIPYARQMAEFLVYPEKFTPDFSKKDFSFWARVVHFESRYWSVDQLMSNLQVKNILELSSGFSCRGLDTIRKRDVHYIETDLPEVIATKIKFVDSLKSETESAKGKLEVLPLNALDENQFLEIVNRFPQGEIAIINEGLLMYHEKPEKQKLCHIIYNVLHKHGGYWITADIYRKNLQEKLKIKVDVKTQQFFEQHRIEENKFGSFDEAKAFFTSAGFAIDGEAKINRTEISSLKYLLKSMSIKHFFKIIKAGKMNATWRFSITNKN